MLNVVGGGERMGRRWGGYLRTVNKIEKIINFIKNGSDQGCIILSREPNFY